MGKTRIQQNKEIAGKYTYDKLYKDPETGEENVISVFDFPTYSISKDYDPKRTSSLIGHVQRNNIIPNFAPDPKTVDAFAKYYATNMEGHVFKKGDEARQLINHNNSLIDRRINEQEIGFIEDNYEKLKQDPNRVYQDEFNELERRKQLASNTYLSLANSRASDIAAKMEYSNSARANSLRSGQILRYGTTNIDPIYIDKTDELDVYYKPDKNEYIDKQGNVRQVKDHKSAQLTGWQKGTLMASKVNGLANVFRPGKNGARFMMEKLTGQEIPSLADSQMNLVYGEDGTVLEYDPKYGYIEKDLSEVKNQALLYNSITGDRQSSSGIARFSEELYETLAGMGNYVPVIENIASDAMLNMLNDKDNIVGEYLTYAKKSSDTELLLMNTINFGETEKEKGLGAFEGERAWATAGMIAAQLLTAYGAGAATGGVKIASSKLLNGYLQGIAASTPLSLYAAAEMDNQMRSVGITNPSDRAAMFATTFGMTSITEAIGPNVIYGRFAPNMQNKAMRTMMSRTFAETNDRVKDLASPMGREMLSKGINRQVKRGISGTAAGQIILGSFEEGFEEAHQGYWQEALQVWMDQKNYAFNRPEGAGFYPNRDYNNNKGILGNAWEIAKENDLYYEEALWGMIGGGFMNGITAPMQIKKANQISTGDPNEWVLSMVQNGRAEEAIEEINKAWKKGYASKNFDIDGNPLDKSDPDAVSVNDVVRNNLIQQVQFYQEQLNNYDISELTIAGLYGSRLLEITGEKAQLKEQINEINSNEELKDDVKEAEVNKINKKISEIDSEIEELTTIEEGTNHTKRHNDNMKREAVIIERAFESAKERYLKEKNSSDVEYKNSKEEEADKKAKSQNPKGFDKKYDTKTDLFKKIYQEEIAKKRALSFAKDFIKNKVEAHKKSLADQSNKSLLQLPDVLAPFDKMKPGKTSEADFKEAMNTLIRTMNTINEEFEIDSDMESSFENIAKMAESFVQKDVDMLKELNPNEDADMETLYSNIMGAFEAVDALRAGNFKDAIRANLSQSEDVSVSDVVNSELRKIKAKIDDYLKPEEVADNESEAKKADIERINEERDKKLKTTGKKQVEKHLKGIRQPFNEDLEPTQEEIDAEINPYARSVEEGKESAEKEATFQKIKKSGVLAVINSLEALKQTLEQNPTLATKEILEEIKQLENKLKKLGIEIPDIKGIEYKEGMKLIATFKDSSNENSTTGIEVITSVQRPHVNYKGRMVQSAKVTVTENYDSEVDSKTLADKINAKYDAELAALEQQPLTEERSLEDIPDMASLFGSLSAELSETMPLLESLEYLETLEKLSGKLKDNLTESDREFFGKLSNVASERKALDNELRPQLEKLQPSLESNKDEVIAKAIHLEMRRKMLYQILGQDALIEKLLSEQDFKDYKSIMNILDDIEMIPTAEYSKIGAENKASGVTFQRSNITEEFISRISDIDIKIKQVEDFLTKHKDALLSKEMLKGVYEVVFTSQDGREHELIANVRSNTDDDNGLYLEKLTHFISQSNTSGIASKEEVSKLGIHVTGDSDEVTLAGKYLLQWLDSLHVSNNDFYASLGDIYNKHSDSDWMMALTGEQEIILKSMIGSYLSEGKSFKEFIEIALELQFGGDEFLNENAKKLHAKYKNRNGYYLRGMYGAGKTTVGAPFMIMMLLRVTGEGKTKSKPKNIEFYYHNPELESSFRKMIDPVIEEYGLNVTGHHISTATSRSNIASREVDLMIFDEAGMIPRSTEMSMLDNLAGEKSLNNKGERPFTLFMGDRSQMSDRRFTDGNRGITDQALSSQMFNTSAPFTQVFSTLIPSLQNAATAALKNEPQPDWNYVNKDGDLFGTRHHTSVSNVVEEFKERFEKREGSEDPVIVFASEYQRELKEFLDEDGRVLPKYKNNVFILTPNTGNVESIPSIQGLRRNEVYMAFSPQNITDYNVEGKVQFKDTDTRATTYTAITRSRHYVSMVANGKRASNVVPTTSAIEFSPNKDAIKSRGEIYSGLYKSNNVDHYNDESTVNKEKAKDNVKGNQTANETETVKHSIPLKFYQEGETKKGNRKHTFTDVFTLQINENGSEYMWVTLKLSSGGQMTINLRLDTESEQRVTASKVDTAEKQAILDELNEVLPSGSISAYQVFNELNSLGHEVIPRKQEGNVSGYNENAINNILGDNIISKLSEDSDDINLTDDEGTLLAEFKTKDNYFYDIATGKRIPWSIVFEALNKGDYVLDTGSITTEVANEGSETDSKVIGEIQYTIGESVLLNNGMQYEVSSFKNVEGVDSVILSGDDGIIVLTEGDFVNILENNANKDNTPDFSDPVEETSKGFHTAHRNSWGSFSSLPYNQEMNDALTDTEKRQIRILSFKIGLTKPTVKAVYKDTQQYLDHNGSVNTENGVIDIEIIASKEKLAKIAKSYGYDSLAEKITSNEGVYNSAKVLMSLQKPQLSFGQAMSIEQILSTDARSVDMEWDNSIDIAREQELISLYQKMHNSTSRESNEFIFSPESYYLTSRRIDGSQKGISLNGFSNSVKNDHGENSVLEFGIKEIKVDNTPRKINTVSVIINNGDSDIATLNSPVAIRSKTISELSANEKETIKKELEGSLSAIKKAKNNKDLLKAARSSFAYHILMQNRSKIKNDPKYSELNSLLIWPSNDVKIKHNDSNISKIDKDINGWTKIISLLKGELSDKLFFPVVWGEEKTSINQYGLDVLSVNSREVTIPSAFINHNDIEINEPADNKPLANDNNDVLFDKGRKSRSKKNVRSSKVSKFDGLVSKIMGVSGDFFEVVEGQKYDEFGNEIYGEQFGRKIKVYSKDGKVKPTTPRHEINHWIIRNFLKSDRKAAIFAEARKRAGNEDMSDTDTMEWIARDHASLYQGRETGGVKGILLEFYNALRRVVNNLFHHQSELTKLYKEIESGEFADSNFIEPDPLQETKDDILYDKEDDTESYRSKKFRRESNVINSFGGYSQMNRVLNTFRYMVANRSVFSDQFTVEGAIDFLKNEMRDEAKRKVYDKDGRINGKYEKYLNGANWDVLNDTQKIEFRDYILADNTMFNTVLKLIAPSKAFEDSINTKDKRERKFDIYSSAALDIFLSTVRYVNVPAKEGKTEEMDVERGMTNWIKTKALVPSNVAKRTMLNAVAQMKSDGASSFALAKKNEVHVLESIRDKLIEIADNIKVNGEVRNTNLSVAYALTLLIDSSKKQMFNSLNTKEEISRYIEHRNLIGHMASLFTNTYKRNSLNVKFKDSGVAVIEAYVEEAKAAQYKLKDALIGKLFNEDAINDKVKYLFSDQQITRQSDGSITLDTYINGVLSPIVRYDGDVIEFVDLKDNINYILDLFKELGVFSEIKKDVVRGILEATPENNPYSALDKSQEKFNMKLKHGADQTTLQMMLASMLMGSVHSINNIKLLKDLMAENSKFNYKEAYDDVTDRANGKLSEELLEKLNVRNQDLGKVLSGSEDADMDFSAKVSTPADFYHVQNLLAEIQVMVKGINEDAFVYDQTGTRFLAINTDTDLTARFNHGAVDDIELSDAMRDGDYESFNSIPSHLTRVINIESISGGLKASNDPVTYDYAKLQMEMFFESLTKTGRYTNEALIPMLSLSSRKDMMAFGMRGLQMEYDKKNKEYAWDRDQFSKDLKNRQTYHYNMHKNTLSAWKDFIAENNLTAFTGKNPFYEIPITTKNYSRVVRGEFNKFVSNVNKKKGFDLLAALQSSNVMTLNGHYNLVDGKVKASHTLAFSHYLFNASNHGKIDEISKLDRADKTEALKNFMKKYVIDDITYIEKESGYKLNEAYLEKNFSSGMITNSLGDVNTAYFLFTFANLVYGGDFNDLAFGYQGTYSSSDERAKRGRTRQTPKHIPAGRHEFALKESYRVVPVSYIPETVTVKGEEIKMKVTDDGGARMTMFGLEMMKISYGEDNAPFSGATLKPIHNGVNKETGFGEGLKYSSTATTPDQFNSSYDLRQIEYNLLDVWSDAVNEEAKEWNLDLNLDIKEMFINYYENMGMSVRDALLTMLKDIKNTQNEVVLDIVTENVPLFMVPPGSFKFGNRGLNNVDVRRPNKLNSLKFDLSGLGIIMNLSEDFSGMNGRLVPPTQTYSVIGSLSPSIQSKIEGYRSKLFELGVKEYQKELNSIYVPDDIKNTLNEETYRVKEFLRQLSASGLKASGSDAKFIDLLLNDNVDIRIPSIAEKVRQTFRSYITHKTIKTSHDGIRATQVSPSWLRLYRDEKGFLYTLNDMKKYFRVNELEFQKDKIEVDGMTFTKSQLSPMEVKDNKLSRSEVAMGNLRMKEFGMTSDMSLNDFYSVGTDTEFGLLRHNSPSQNAKYLKDVYDNAGANPAFILRAMQKKAIEITETNIKKFIENFEKSLETFSVRIPTGKSGQLVVQKTAFFVNDSENTIFYPAGNNIRTDADYDGDQLSVYSKHIDKDGNIIDDENSIAGVHNKIIESFEEALNSNPSILDEISDVSYITNYPDKKDSKFSFNGFSESVKSWKKSRSSSKAVGIQANVVSAVNSILSNKSLLPNHWNILKSGTSEEIGKVLNYLGDWLQVILDNEKSNALGNYSISSYGVNLIGPLILRNSSLNDEFTFDSEHVTKKIYDFFNNNSIQSILSKIEYNDRVQNFGSKSVFAESYKELNTLQQTLRSLSKEFFGVEKDILTDADWDLLYEEITSVNESISKVVGKDIIKLMPKMSNLYDLLDLLEESDGQNKAENYIEDLNLSEKDKESILKIIDERETSQWKEILKKNSLVNQIERTGKSILMVQELMDVAIDAEGLRRISHFISVRQGIKTAQFDFDDYLYNSEMYLGLPLSEFLATKNVPTKEEYLMTVKGGNAYRQASDVETRDAILEQEEYIYNRFNIAKMFAEDDGPLKSVLSQLQPYVNPYFTKRPVQVTMEEQSFHTRIKESFLTSLLSKSWTSKEQRTIFTEAMHNGIINEYFQGLDKSRATFNIIPFELNSKGQLVLPSNISSTKELSSLYEVDIRESYDKFRDYAASVVSFFTETLNSDNITEDKMISYYQSVLGDSEGKMYWNNTIKPIYESLTSDDQGKLFASRIRTGHNRGKKQLMFDQIDDAMVPQLKASFESIKDKKLKDLFVFHSLISAKFSFSKYSMTSIIPNNYYEEISRSLDSFYKNMNKNSYEASEDEFIQFIASNAKSLRYLSTSPNNERRQNMIEMDNIPMYSQASRKFGIFSYPMSYKNMPNGEAVLLSPISSSKIFNWNSKKKQSVLGVEVFRKLNFEDLISLEEGKSIIVGFAQKVGYHESQNLILPNGTVVHATALNQRTLRIKKTKNTVESEEDRLQAHSKLNKLLSVSDDERFVNTYENGMFRFSEINPSENKIPVYISGANGSFPVTAKWAMSRGTLNSGYKLFTNNNQNKSRAYSEEGVYNKRNQVGAFERKGKLLSYAVTPVISQQRQQAQSFNKKVRPEVSELFDSNPELANIGTQEQYSQYLDTIFPDSKVKDIVYHGTPRDFEKFIKDAPQYNDQSIMAGVRGVIHFFSKSNLQKYFHISQVRTVSAILDIRNPTINKGKLSGYDVKITDTYKNPPIDATKDTDGFILNLYESDYGLDNEVAGEKGYAVFEPEQIHILGSKQDIEGFKEFISNNTYKQEQNNIETESSTILQSTRDFIAFAKAHPDKEFLFMDNSTSMKDHADIANAFQEEYKSSGVMPQNIKLPADLAYSVNLTVDSEFAKNSISYDHEKLMPLHPQNIKIDGISLDVVKRRTGESYSDIYWRAYANNPDLFLDAFKAIGDSFMIRKGKASQEVINAIIGVKNAVYGNDNDANLLSAVQLKNAKIAKALEMMRQMVPGLIINETNTGNTFVDKNGITINIHDLSPDMAIHEISHIFHEWLRQNNIQDQNGNNVYDGLVSQAKAMYNSGDVLITAIHAHISKKGYSEEKMWNEILSTYSGLITSELALEAMAEYDVIESALVDELSKSVVNKSIENSKMFAAKLSQAIQNVNTIAGNIGNVFENGAFIENMTLEDMYAGLMNSLKSGDSIFGIDSDVVSSVIENMDERYHMQTKTKESPGVRSLADLDKLMRYADTTGANDIRFMTDDQLVELVYSNMHYRDGNMFTVYNGKEYSYPYNGNNSDKIKTNIKDFIVPEMREYEDNYKDNLINVLEHYNTNKGKKDYELMSSIKVGFGESMRVTNDIVEEFLSIISANGNFDRVIRYSDLKNQNERALNKLYDESLIGEDPILIVHEASDNHVNISLFDATSQSLEKRPFLVRNNNVLGFTINNRDFDWHGGTFTNKNKDVRAFKLGLTATHLLKQGNVSISALSVLKMNQAGVEHKSFADMSKVNQNLKAASKSDAFMNMIKNENIKDLIESPVDNSDFTTSRLKNYLDEAGEESTNLNKVLEDKSITLEDKEKAVLAYLERLRREDRAYKTNRSYIAASEFYLQLKTKRKDILSIETGLNYFESRVVGLHNLKTPLMQHIKAVYDEGNTTIRNKMLHINERLGSKALKIIRNYKIKTPGGGLATTFFDNGSKFFENMYIKTKAYDEKTGEMVEVKTREIHYDKSDPRTAKALSSGIINNSHIEFAQELMALNKEIWIEHLLYLNQVKRKNKGYTKESALKDFEAAFGAGNAMPVMNKSTWELMFSGKKNAKLGAKLFVENIGNDAKLFDEVTDRDLSRMNDSQVKNIFAGQLDQNRADAMIGLQKIGTEMINGRIRPKYKVVNRTLNNAMSTNAYNSIRYLGMSTYRQQVYEKDLMPFTDAVKTVLETRKALDGTDLKYTVGYLDEWIKRNIDHVNNDAQKDLTIGGKYKANASVLARGALQLITFSALGYNLSVGMKSHAFNTIQQGLLGLSYSAQGKIGDRVADGLQKGKETMFTAKSYAKAQALLGMGVPLKALMSKENSNFIKYFRIAKELGVVMTSEKEVLEHFMMNLSKRHLLQNDTAQVFNLVTDIYARLTTMVAVMDTEGSLDAYDYNFKTGEVVYNEKKDKRFYTESGKKKTENGEHAILEQIKSNVQKQEFRFSIGHDAKLISNIRRVSDKYVIGAFTNDVKPLLSNHWFGALISQFRIFSLEKLFNAGMFASTRETIHGAGYRATQDDDGTWITRDDVIEIEGFWQASMSMLEILKKNNGVTLKSWWNNASQNRKFLFIRGLMRLSATGIILFLIRGFGESEKDWKYKWLWTDMLDGFMITEIFKNPIPAMDFTKDLWNVIARDQDVNRLLNKIAPGTSNDKTIDNFVNIVSGNSVISNLEDVEFGFNRDDE